MASDHLMTMEQPWLFRSTFTDANWISDIFNKETETLTKALQNSYATPTSSNGDVYSAEISESLFAQPDTTPLQTPTASGASENEIPFSKQRKSLPPLKGKVTKRKSRATKRASTTTFITADPANFRQMVQQVTGVRFGGLNGLQLPIEPMMKAEPKNEMQFGGGLPTLDTSAFFLDGAASSMMNQLPPPPSTVAGFEYESYCSFPTLESWKVM